MQCLDRVCRLAPSHKAHQATAPCPVTVAQARRGRAHLWFSFHVNISWIRKHMRCPGRCLVAKVDHGCPGPVLASGPSSKEGFYVRICCAVGRAAAGLLLVGGGCSWGSAEATQQVVVLCCWFTCFLWMSCSRCCCLGLDWRSARHIEQVFLWWRHLCFLGCSVGRLRGRMHSLCSRGGSGPIPSCAKA